MKTRIYVFNFKFRFYLNIEVIPHFMNSNCFEDF